MQKTIVVGSVAYDPKVVDIWEGIRQFFLGMDCPMDYVLFSNYEAQVEALLSGKIDIAWNTNLAYVKAHRQLSGKARIIAMRDTDIAFTTRLVAAKSANINSLSDLKGKKVAFGSRDSAQAAVVPEYYLLQEGLKAGRDYEAVRFNSDLGKHGDTGRSELEVINAVQEGTADAGATGEGTWLRLEAAGKVGDLTCFWTSPAYSHCNFTVMPDFDEKLAAAFVKTLLKMDYNNPEHKKILDAEGLKKWVTGELANYKAIFEAADATGYLNCAAEPVCSGT